MLDVLKWFVGKRTYIIAILIIVLSVLEGLGVIQVPAEVWGLLGGTGLMTLRIAVSNAFKEIKQKTTTPSA